MSGPIPPVTGASSSRVPTRRRSWESTLDELEYDVAYMEAAMGKRNAQQASEWSRKPWEPPADLGPMPEDLRLRAARILQRQLDVAEALVEQATQSKRQRDVAARMTHDTGHGVAAFIDRAM